MIRKKRFLVVDDENLIRFFFKESFKLHDMQVELARNGREAIEKWEREDFNAILMDISMPEMDGYQATQIIRQREQNENRRYTPIYAMSGFVPGDPHSVCHKAGMDGFFKKPFDFNQILQCMQPLCHGD